MIEELWLSLDSLYDVEGWLIDAKQPVPKWLKALITKAEKELGVRDGR